MAEGPGAPLVANLQRIHYNYIYNVNLYDKYNII
jgi:hypothetical protein